MILMIIKVIYVSFLFLLFGVLAVGGFYLSVDRDWKDTLKEE